MAALKSFPQVTMRLFVRDIAGSTHCVEPAATETVAGLKAPGSRRVVETAPELRAEKAV